LNCKQENRQAHPMDERDERDIPSRERALRAWFTCDADAVLRQIDGLDIGWGGVQRWATARMPFIACGLHLDLACGYATFLAQLGWRYPEASLVGLNIDFCGAHALARPLLVEAGVHAVLVQADARQMPFADDTFDSASCFLGLQDVEIGFGEAGVRQTLAESVRVLRTGGMLVLLDAFPLQRFEALLDGLPVVWIEGAERALDVRWMGEVAMRAVELYAEGWVAQMRLPAKDRATRELAYRETLNRLQSEVETQMTRQGYYVPFDLVRMVVAHKLGTGRCSC
jgi:ubiquinone/menaquinone biosynthesis C-methylase UbiE